MKRFLIVACAILVMTSTAAGAERPFRDKQQAEAAVLKTLTAAAMKSQHAKASFNFSAICTGVGPHRGVRYRTFLCRVTKPNGDKMVVKYLAVPGGHYKLVRAAATAPATTTTRRPTRVTFTRVGPRIAQPGELVRVAGRVIGGRTIVAAALFRVSESGSTTRRKIIRVHESRFNTWTRISKPGVHRVFVFYPGDRRHLPSSASVQIRVT